MTRTRVLVLTPDFPPALGGIQLLVHRVVALSPRLEPLVVTLGEPGAGHFDDRQPFAVHRLPAGWGRSRRAKAALGAVAIGHALRFRPDAVVSAHIITSPAARVIRRLLGCPVVQYLYADEMRARPRLTAAAVCRADATITISGHTHEMALATGVAAERLTLIPPGVDLPGPPAAERDTRPTILTVSRLEDRYKGHDVLMRAMPAIRARVPGARWVVVGGGTLRPELERLARAAGLDDAVHFTGPVDDAERDRWLDRAHVFAMPSRLPPGPGGGGEGFGIVFMEASAHGLPVVAGAVGGALDAVRDGETGLLVDPESPAAVAEAIVTLLSDRDAAGRMGAAGRAMAREFAWPRIAARFESLVLEVATSSAGDR